MSESWTILEGDCLDVLRTMPERSVHCVVTSPPYWGLRDYGVDGQIGLEQTPQAFIARLVDVFREVRRVMRDDGTCWVNMGDSYAQNEIRMRNHDSVLLGSERKEAIAVTGRHVRHGLKQKDLIGVPWLLAFALRDDGWYLRQDIIWHKPNPMPESVTDRCTKAHEYLFLLTKKPRYYYDAMAIAEDSIHAGRVVEYDGSQKNCTAGDDTNDRRTLIDRSIEVAPTRNKRSVWTMSTQAFSEAHFATFPMSLPITCIKAGTSERGCCPACGKPWVRTIEKSRKATRPGTASKLLRNGQSIDRQSGDLVDCPNKPWAASGIEVGNRDPKRHVTETVTTGWQPGCECGGDPVPCTVLDPFGGAGTTVLAARRLGRHAIAIELNPEYAEMARRRIVEDAPLLNMEKSA